MSSQEPLGVLFASPKAAEHIVAGVPAAARVVREVAGSERGAAGPEFLIAVRGEWQPSPLCQSEIARLAPRARWRAVDADEAPVANWQTIPLDRDTATVEHADTAKALGLEELRHWGRRIVRDTGKAGDGIVSRHINRPISQAITRMFLRWPGARPWHATLAAGLIGLAMAIALFFGGTSGLMIGAALFQLASIIDGVDGETARATFRTSERGAMLDSVTDAATNLSFVSGVAFNVYSNGSVSAGLAGATGFVLLAIGSALLAIQSRRDGGDFTFDALKTRMRQRPSRLKQWLVWMTMRDFYALAACVAILAGCVQILLFAFATVAAGWLVVVLGMLAMSTRQSE